VYGVELSLYWREFLVLFSGGALYALLAILGATMIVMRLQRASLWCVVSVAAVVGKRQAGSHLPNSLSKM